MYGPADATATNCLASVKLIGFTCLVPAHLGSPGQRAVRQLLLLCCNLQLKCANWT